MGPPLRPASPSPFRPDAIARIDARRHRHRQRLLLPHPALSETRVAGIADDLAAALASGARLLNGENGLLHPNLSLTVAGVAGLGDGALGGAGAFAGVALRQRGNLDLGFGAEHRLFEVEFELIAQIGAPEYLRAAALSARENIAEHLAENIAEGFAGAEPAAAPALETRMPELIVNRALLSVAEHLVGLLGLLELVLGFRIVGISIGMVFHGQTPIGLFDVRLGRVARQLEELVVILLGHYPP